MQSLIKHLPNILTFFRIFAIFPIVLGFYLNGIFNIYFPAIIFIIAAISDFFDGIVARKYNVSNMGKIFDPIADKILVLSTLFMMLSFDIIVGIHIIAALIILVREVLISGIREFVSNNFKIVINVSDLAKLKTTMQMVAISFILVFYRSDFLFYFSLVLFWLSAVLTFYTGYDYVKSVIKIYNKNQKKSTS